MKLHEKGRPLKRSELSLLKKAVKRKFEKECLDNDIPIPEGKSTVYYGYVKKKEGEGEIKVNNVYSLKSSMLANKPLEDYLEDNHTSLNTEIFYKKFENEINKKETIPLDSFFINVCLLYLRDYESIKDFLEKYDSFHYYRGYMYSKLQEGVKEFSVSIDFGLRGTNPTIDVSQWGIHKTFLNDTNLKYEGTAEHKDAYLYMTLENNENQKNLNFIAYIGGGAYTNRRFFYGTYIGVSNDEKPMAGEFVLAKSSKEQVIAFNEQNRKKDLSSSQKREENAIFSYLMMRRNLILSSREIPKNLNDLEQVDKNYQTLKELRGLYKIVNYGKTMSAIVSYFLIKDDFRASLYTRFDKNNFEQQKCHLNIYNNEGINMLNVTTLSTGNRLHNYASFNLNYAPENKFSRKCLSGVFCSVFKKELISNHLIALKCTEEEYKEVVGKINESSTQEEDLDLAKRIPQNEISNEYENNKDLELILKELNFRLKKAGFDRFNDILNNDK